MADVVVGVFDQTRSKQGAIPVQLNPAYAYLRVQPEGGAPALLVLGYLEPHEAGQIEIWYSTSGEVIRLQGGRIVGTAGLATDWRQVRYLQQPPAWDAIRGDALHYERLRDVMPGYRFSVRERLALEVLPSRPLGVNAVQIPDHAFWVEERIEEPTQAGLAPAVYALARTGAGIQVAYSRQCLSPTLCLHLQPWPVRASQP